MTPMKTTLTLLSIPLAAAAQSFSVGSGGISLDNTVDAVILAPPPVQVSESLEMAALPVAMHPPAFHLTAGNGTRYGPYPLRDNTPVGDERSPHLLRMFDAGRHFTLHAPGDTNTVHGPFPATNGAAIAFGGGSLTLQRVPPELTASLNHPDKINQLPLIGIAPWTPALQRELYQLRAKYVALVDRVDADTSSVVFQDVPRVHSRRSSNIVSPVVSVSQRDKQNATQGAQLTAIRHLETLFGQAFRIRSQAFTDGDTYHFSMPPGDYIFCAMQKVKDPAAKGPAPLQTAIWWTAFTFDGEHPLALTLTPDNAITWSEVFTFTR